MVIVCDCHYRSAITAIRGFHKEGEDIIAVTTSRHPKPPSFSSKLIKHKYVLSSDKDLYTNELLSLCKKYDSPILFPIGNFSLNVISENLEAFKQFSRFCISTPNMLSNLNDKKWVKKEADKFGINVPKKFDVNSSCEFPVVVKPFCGEKFNIKASQRYKIVYNKHELESAYNYFKQFDNDPIVEEYICGHGVGVSVLLNNKSEAQTAFCHRRLLEYPISGGPSVYLETFYNETLVDTTKAFLESIGFVGVAMVEYKYSNGEFYLLEINPRIWGSFPSTEKSNSDFIKSYLRACNSIESRFTCEYTRNNKIKFLRGLIMSCLSYLKKGDFKNFFKAFSIVVSPSIPDATFSFKDFLPSIYDFFRR